MALSWNLANEICRGSPNRSSTKQEYCIKGGENVCLPKNLNTLRRPNQSSGGDDRFKRTALYV